MVVLILGRPMGTMRVPEFTAKPAEPTTVSVGPQKLCSSASKVAWNLSATSHRVAAPPPMVPAATSATETAAATGTARVGTARNALP